MFNKIFNKYFFTIATAVIISYLILGAVLLGMTASYSINEKQQSLYTSADKIANLTSNLIQGTSITERIIYENILYNMVQGTDTDMFITDYDGNIIIWYKSNKRQITTSVMDKKILNVVYMQGIYRSTGKFANLYEDDRYTVGVPYMIGNNLLGGAVFLSSPASSLTSLLFDVGRMFFIALVIMLIFAFGGLYYATNRLTKPLKAMSKAAVRFSNGDFDVRLPVTSNDEVGQLAFAFNRMAQSLNELEGMRRDFIANISHDLKTPMTTISGFIDGILDGTISNEKQNYYLQIVSDEIRRLSRLVNSLLDMARLETGKTKLKMDIFNIGEMVTRILLSHEMVINNKNLDVNVNLPEDPAAVVADEDSIYRVVQNLIENALKFTNDSGSLDITVYEKDKLIFTSVKNTGKGIAKDDVAHIFDRFYKTDKSRGVDKNSAGLGLYITKSIVNLNGGEIWVKSVENQYTEFVFTLKKADLNR